MDAYFHETVVMELLSKYLQKWRLILFTCLYVNV